MACTILHRIPHLSSEGKTADWTPVWLLLTERCFWLTPKGVPTSHAGQCEIGAPQYHWYRSLTRRLRGVGSILGVCMAQLVWVHVAMTDAPGSRVVACHLGASCSLSSGCDTS